MLIFISFAHDILHLGSFAKHAAVFFKTATYLPDGYFPVSGEPFRLVEAFDLRKAGLFDYVLLAMNTSPIRHIRNSSQLLGCYQALHASGPAL